MSKKYGKSREAGSGSAGNNEEEEGDELDLSSLHLIEDLKKVSHKTLVDGIIKPRLNELFTMVGIEVKKSGFATQTPAGVVITGGGARTAGAQESARRMLSMPVRVGMPIDITGLIDDVENPAFATAVGLLSYARGYRSTEAPAFFSGILKLFNLKLGRGIFGSISKLIKTFLPK